MGWYGRPEELEDSRLTYWPTKDVDQVFCKRFPRHDAHFVCYYIDDEERIPRINLKAVPTLVDTGIELKFDIAALDVDHQPHSVEPSKAWRKAQEDKVFSSDWGDKCAIYHTKGGYRILCRFAAPLDIAGFEDFLADWRRACYVIGVIPDAARWNGLYRLPYVMREGELQKYPSRRLGDLNTLPAMSPQWLRTHVQEITSVVTPPSEGTDVWQSVADAKGPFVLPKSIEKGTRNNTLYRFACSLRAKGMGEQNILTLLLKEDKARCDPPMQSEQGGHATLESMSYRVTRYDVPHATLTPNQMTRQSKGLGQVIERETAAERALAGDVQSEDCDVGEEVAGSVLRRTEELPLFEHKSEKELASWCVSEMVDDENDLLYDQGTLRRYNEHYGVWEEIPMSEIYRLVMSIDRAPIYMGQDRRTGKPKVKPLEVSNALTESVAKLVCKQVESPGCFSKSAPGIVFRNGFVRVTKEGPKVEPFSREHLAVTRIDYDFDHNAVTPLMDGFLSDILIGVDAPAKLKFMWEFMGCSLSGLGTTMQRALLMQGEGANGKSTLLNVWIKLFPSNVVTSISPQDMHNEYRLAHLKKSLLNAVNEAPAANIAKSAALKAVITGDRVMGRHIRQDVFEYRPKAAHVFACNALPSFSDQSEGFSRRWVVLLFDREFAESEQVRGLDNKILDAEKGKVICRALVHACDALKRGHYEEPLTSTNERKKWRKDNDPVMAFLEEMCEESDQPGEGVVPLQLYSAFRSWVSVNGMVLLGSTTFYRRLRSLRISSKTVRGQKLYGLSMRSTDIH